MMTRCENCGIEIEDPRGDHAKAMFSIGVPAEQIFDSFCRKVYCDDCEKEAQRLNEQARELTVAISYATNKNFKRFGYERKRDRTESELSRK